MTSFTEPLIVQKIKGMRWKVARAFRYYIGENNSNEYVDVPEGYVTDFCSIPRLFWRILPPDGNYTQASVVHDICYQKQLFSQKKCDDIFLEAMTVLGVPKWKRWVIHRALRMFGFISYKRAGKNLKASQ